MQELNKSGNKGNNSEKSFTLLYAWQKFVILVIWYTVSGFIYIIRM